MKPMSPVVEVSDDEGDVRDDNDEDFVPSERDYDMETTLKESIALMQMLTEMQVSIKVGSFLMWEKVGIIQKITVSMSEET